MSQLGLARAWKRRELSYLESLASCASYAAREENRNSLTVVDKWMEAKMLTWFVMGGNDAAMIEVSCPRSSIVGCCCGVAVMDVEVAGVDGETAGYIICLLDYKVERIILWTLYVSMYPKKKKTDRYDLLATSSNLERQTHTQPMIASIPVEGSTWFETWEENFMVQSSRYYESFDYPLQFAPIDHDPWMDFPWSLLSSLLFHFPSGCVSFSRVHPRDVNTQLLAWGPWPGTGKLILRVTARLSPVPWECSCHCRLYGITFLLAV